MSWLVVEGGDRRIGVRSGALVVERAGEPVRIVRPQDVDEVHLFGDVEMSAAARRVLLLEGVDTVFYTRDGRVRGRMTSQESRAGQRRLAQLRAVVDPQRRVRIARSIVSAKVWNQYVVLRRVQRRARDQRLADALALLRSAARRAARCEDLERLRGIEGAAAAAYFRVFGLALTHPLFRFDGRNRRPPRDPVNAVLSFLYTLLVQRTEHAARGAGLDPYVGFLHDAGRGAPAVAFDLAEAWRPVVDALTLALFNRRQLAPEDFVDPGAKVDLVGLPPEPAAGGGEPGPRDAGEAEPPEAPRAVYLGAVGRKVVIQAWAGRLRERLRDRVGGRRESIENLVRLQAQRLAHAVEHGEDYREFRWE